MTPEQVLAHPPKVLTQAQREAYFETGYILLEQVIEQDWLDRLGAVTAEMVEKSRQVTTSDAIFDLEPGHSAASPRLRRLSSPVEHHPLYWEFAGQSIVPDIVADLVGPDVKFHHAKLNFKWAEGGEEVKWHQDIQAWAHTNYSPVTVGLYLNDVGPEQGPLGVVPGSHKGRLFDQYNDKGQWVGHIADADLAGLPMASTEYLIGPAGSLTLHNCRTVHGSKPNLTDQGRPLLLNVYSSADAYTYTRNPLPSRYEGTILRGKRALRAHLDPEPCLLSPDWSGGYTSLYAMQQQEDWSEQQMATVERQFAAAGGKAAE